MIKQAVEFEGRFPQTGGVSLRKLQLCDTAEFEELFAPNAECIPLSLQPLALEAGVLDVGAVRIVAHNEQTSLRLRRRGCRGRLLIGYSNRADAVLKWGRECSRHDLIAVGEGEADITLLGPSEFVWLDIDVSSLAVPGVAALLEAIPESAVLKPADGPAQKMRGYVAAAMQMCFADPLLILNRAMRGELQNDLLERIIGTLRSAEIDAADTKAEHKVSAVVHQAEQFMWENVEEPITLERICAATHSRTRSLIYCFKRAFGLGPIAYLKIRRLDAAHRRLKETRGTVRIADVAADFGFWHMGHFSVDYKRMFGSTASQTVAAARTQHDGAVS